MPATIQIETSARHLHVSRATLNTLFGEGYALTNKKDLSQPGQFACSERVTVVGPKGQLIATILGPIRPETQVELSLTDARSIGLAVPVRESGDIAGSPGCTLVGPAGEVVLPHGVIAAKRHIHATPTEAAAYGLQDKQVVQVRYAGAGRALTFGDVVVRVRDDFAWAMHIDTDESNAGGLAPGAQGELVL